MSEFNVLGFLAFLNGEVSIDDRWFCDAGPIISGQKRPFWWRNHLPKVRAEFYRLKEESETLRAELTEARRQLKEASEQEPMFWYVPALSDDDEDALVLPARDGKCPSSYQTASAIPLYADPVPQPAVPEAVASDADWNHVPVGRVIGDPVWAGQLWRSQIQGTKKLRHGDLVYIRPVAILSATDSEVKKDV